MKNDITRRLEAVATLMNSGERARDQGKTPDYKPKAGKLHTTRASRTTSITISVWEEGRRVCASFVWVVSRSVFMQVFKEQTISRGRSHTFQEQTTVVSVGCVHVRSQQPEQIQCEGYFVFLLLKLFYAQNFEVCETNCQKKSQQHLYSQCYKNTMF